MATTNITQSVKDITGISSLSTYSIEDGQRFVVSSIPKDLLLFAQTASSPSTDGSAISFSINDSIVDVQRNGYSCREIPMSEAIWALDSTSLRYATAKYPKFYHKQGAVHFAPVTDGSNAGYIFYLDYSKLDDDCDLRNAVIYRVCSLEFTKLASGKITDWVDVDVPVAPGSPSFGSDLTISVSTPVAPSSPSFTYTDASVSDIVKPLIAISDMAALSASAPGYTKPVVSLEAAPTITDLSVNVVAPVSPPVKMIVYNDAFISDILTGTMTAPSLIDVSGNAPTYIKPVFSVPTLSSVGSITLPSVPVSPSLSTTTVSFSEPVPTYTKPVLSLTGNPSITDLDINSVAPVSPETPSIDSGAIAVGVATPTYIKPSLSAPTLDSVGSLTLPSIPVKPDVSAQSVTITGTAPTYVKPVVSLTSFPATSWVFPSPPVRPQVSAQVVADFSSEAPTYTRPVFSSPTLGAVGSLTLPSMPVPPSSPSFTYDDVTGISDIVEPLISISDMSALSASAPTYTKPVVSLQDIPTISNLTITASPPVAPRLTDNSVSFSQPAPTYTGPVVSPDFAQVVTYIDTEEDVELASAKIREIDTRLNEFQGKIQNELNTFNKENAAYQAELQVAIQNAQLDQSDESMLLQKYSNDLQKYQAEVSKEVQEYQQNLEGDTRAWQAGRQTDLQKYGSDIQNELNEFNRTNVIYQEDIQRKNANLQKEIQQAVQNAQNAYTTKKANLDKNQKIAADNALQNFQEGAQLYQSELSKYQAEVSSYQAETNSIIQKWVNEEWTQNFEKYRTDYDNLIKTYTSDMQNSVNDFNKEVQIYQATIQKNIQEAQLSDSNEARKIQNYQQEISSYSANVSRVVQGNQAECEAWQKENATAIQKYGVDIQNALNVFNKESIEYTSKLQKDLKDADLSDGNESKKIQLYQAELTAYQTEVGAIVQKWVNEEWTQSFQKYQTDYASLLQTYQADLQNELNDFNKGQSIFQNDLQERIQEATNLQNKDSQEYSLKLQKYASEIQTYQADINKEVQEYTINELQKELVIWNKNIDSELQKYASDIQNELNEFNKEHAVYQAQLQISIKNADLSDAADSKNINKYQNELSAYQAEVGAIIQKWTQEEWTQNFEKYRNDYASLLQEYQSNIQNELNEFNKGNARYQIEFQEAVTKANHDMETASQNLQVEIDVKKTNLQKDQANVLQNAQNQMQALIADNNSKFQVYQTNLQNYQFQVTTQIQEYDANLRGDLEVWQAERTTDLQKFSTDIQNELNEFNKDNVVYQEDIQRKAQNLQKDIQEAVQNAQNDIAINNANLTKDVQVALQNAIQDFQQDVQEYSADIQRYSAELNGYQQAINKELQDYTNTLSKNVQEYQNKIALYTADVQKFQASIGNQAQKTTMTAQQAQHYQAEADKYYKWSVNEVSSYIANNSKMIDRTMAAQVAAQQQ